MEHLLIVSILHSSHLPTKIGGVGFQTQSFAHLCHHAQTIVINCGAQHGSFCDAGRVFINDKPAKASAQVKVGDVIKVQFGTREVKAEVLMIKDTVRKEEAELMYRML